MRLWTWPAVVAVVLLASATLSAAEAPPGDEDLVARMSSPDEAAWRAAAAVLEGRGDAVLLMLLNARAQAHDQPAVLERLNLLLEKLFEPWMRTLTALERPSWLQDPADEYLKKFVRLPPDGQALFWAYARAEFAKLYPAPPPDWRDTNVLARLGEIPANDKTVLLLKADGTGTYTRIVDLQAQIALGRALRPKEGPDIEQALQDGAAYFKLKDTSKVAVRPVEPVKGSFIVNLQFPSLEALNAALASSNEAWRTEFAVQSGPQGGKLLTRERTYVKENPNRPEQMFELFGVREEILIKNEWFIRRTGGTQTALHNVTWSGAAADLLSSVVVAVELVPVAAPAAPPVPEPGWKQPPPFKVVVVNAEKHELRYEPCPPGEYRLLELRSPRRADRRRAAWELQQFVPRDRTPYGGTLVQALAVEPDLTTQLEIWTALVVWYGKDLPYGDVAAWKIAAAGETKPNP